MPLRTYYGIDDSSVRRPVGPRILFENTRQSRYYDKDENHHPKYKPLKIGGKSPQTPFTY